MDNFNIGTLEELKHDLISGDWFIVGGDPEALEEFHNKVFPDLKAVKISEKPLKITFWAKKTPLVKRIFDYHDWTSNLIMVEFVNPIKSAILSKATYIRDESKIEENVDKLLSKL